MFEPQAFLSAIAILSAAYHAAASHPGAKRIEEFGRNALESALKKKVGELWADYRHQGQELLNHDLQRVLRASYLKSVIAVANECESHQPSGLLMADVTPWVSSIRKAADAELNCMKSKDYTVRSTAMLKNVAAVLQPHGAEAAVNEMEAAVLNELAEEFSVSKNAEFHDGTLFMEHLHLEIGKWKLLGRGCPDQLWAMFAEGWTTGTRLEGAANPGEYANRNGRVRWIDLVTQFTADALNRNSQAQIAYEREILSRLATRESTISAGALEKALSQVAAGVQEHSDRITSRLDDLMSMNQSQSQSLKSGQDETRQSFGELKHQVGKEFEDLRLQVAMSTKEAREGWEQIRHLRMSLIEQADKPQELRHQFAVSEQEEAVLQGYLDWVVREFRYLPNALRINRESIPLALDRVYVTVRGLSATVTELRQSWLRRRGRIPSSLRERDQRKQYAADSVKAVDLAHAFRDSPTMVILGDPGSGKSTLSRWLALNFARAMRSPQPDEVLVSNSSVDPNAEHEGDLASLGPPRLPIFIQIRDIANEIRLAGERPLEEYLACGKFTSQPAYPEGHPLQHEPIERKTLTSLFLRYIEAQRAVILLDGLDEVGTVAERLQIVARIHDFMERRFGSGRGNQLVVTSRVVGYEANPLRNSVARYTIEAMDEAATRVFIHSWHAGWSEALQNRSPEERREQSERVSNSLVGQVFAEGGHSLRQIASNPLMLSLLCALNLEGGERLPKSRTELYAALVRRELDESWLTRRPGREPLREIVIRMLARVANFIHKSSATNMIERRQLDAVTAEIINGDPAFDVLRSSAAELTSGATDGAGLLVERGFQQYAFRHQTIQEYLAALCLVDDPTMASTRMWEHCGDSRWHEVLLFAMGIMAPLDRGRWLDTLCEEFLQKEDAGEDLSSAVTLLLANAMAQIPTFPLESARKVLRRLLVRYAQMSLNGRQAAFCETVEEIFAREAKQKELRERREAALELLREFASSAQPEDCQAAAAVASRGGIADSGLVGILARAVFRDRGRGNWRVRRFLVNSLSRGLTRFPAENDVDSRICSALDPAALATLSDPEKVHSSKYSTGQEQDESEPLTLQEDLFPLRQCLLRDSAALSHLQSSPGWIKVVVALQGGFCYLGIEELESSFIATKARLDTARAGLTSLAQLASDLDGDLAPRMELMRSRSFGIDPALIWRGSPLSSWLGELLAARTTEAELVPLLNGLWSDPDSDLARGLIDEFAWNWFPEDPSAADRVRAMLMTDCLLALAALGYETEAEAKGAAAPTLHAAFRTECEWLEAYLKEPGYRALLILEKWLDGANQGQNVKPPAEKPPSSTANAVEIAFGDESAFNWEKIADPAAAVLYRAFVNGSVPEQDQAAFDDLSTTDLLQALAYLSMPRSVPWIKEEHTGWVSRCLSREESSSFLLMVLIGVSRIPDSFDRLRSLALRAAGQIGQRTKDFLPLAIRLTRDWPANGDLFRFAMATWLSDDPPDSDEKWNAVRSQNVRIGGTSDSVATFWVTRLAEPDKVVARRNWLSTLYSLAGNIPSLDARLPAELHIFMLCDADETGPQWRRMKRLAEGFNDPAKRAQWSTMLGRVRELVVERGWSVDAESRNTGQLFAIASLAVLLGNRPIKNFGVLRRFDEDRPFGLAMYWAYLLWNDSDDPVYSCAVVLDTLGKTLGANIDDLMRSLVLLETWIAMPFARDWPVVPIARSSERRRDLMMTALMVLFRFPQKYQMLVEWVMRRLLPYIMRLDRELVAMSIAVLSRLAEVHSSGLLRLLSPGSGGNPELALKDAREMTPLIPDAYLRWRTEWVLGSLTGRRRPLVAMLDDLSQLVSPDEISACVTLLTLEGGADLTRTESWQRLQSSLPADYQRGLEESGAPAARKRSASIEDPADADTAMESSLTWIQDWAAGERSEQERNIAAVIDLRLRMIRLNHSTHSPQETEFWRCVADGRPIDETLIVADPLTGLRWIRLQGDHLDDLRRALPPSDPPPGSCPSFLKFIRGTAAEVVPFLHVLASSRNDVCGDWAALMLAESSNWTRRVVDRVRSLLKSPEAVLRNRALFALARGGDWRVPNAEEVQLSSSTLGREVVEEMVSTLSSAARFHPVVDMTMLFALDRIVFDDPEQFQAWFNEASRPGAAQKRAKAVLEHVCRASLTICRGIGASLATASPAVQAAMIQMSICLWERENWRSDSSVWPPIRISLLEIARSGDPELANKAIEAIGWVGLGEHGSEMLALANQRHDRKPAILRAFGLAAASGYSLSAAEAEFMFDSLSDSDSAVRIGAAETALRAEVSMEYLDRLVDTDVLLSALIARLDSYYIGEPFVRKVRQAGTWLDQITYAERCADFPLQDTTFGRLLCGISSKIATQSFSESRQYPAQERLQYMLAVAAAGAELMPDTCESLIGSLPFPLVEQLESVVRRHASYVARQAALVLLSFCREFCAPLARALHSALGDLSMLQATAIECVSRIEQIDAQGLEEMKRLIQSKDELVALAAARVVMSIASRSELSPEMRSQFEDAMAGSLRAALDSGAPGPSVAFAIESSLDRWSYRPVFLGFVKEAQEEALFSLRYPASPARALGKRRTPESVELEIAALRQDQSTSAALSFGPHTAKSKHPAMNQSHFRSTILGESIPSEIMDALEKVQKLHLELNVSYAKTLHIAIQSRFFRK